MVSHPQKLLRPQFYYFGRLNILSPYSDKKGLIESALQKDQHIDIKEYRWRFLNIVSFKYENYEYITGYLAKYKLTTEEEIADEEHSVIAWEEASKRIQAKSRFFLQIHTGLICYHQIRHKIMRSQFISNFCNLFRNAHDNFFIEVEIQSIDEKYHILEFMKNFGKISRVSIYLHPSNPQSGIWKDVDNRLKELQISSYKEEYSAKQGNSLNILEDEDFNNKVNMAIDGYGEAMITGTHEGEEKTVYTGQNPITAKSSNKDTEYLDVLKDIIKAFQSIIERYN